MTPDTRQSIQNVLTLLLTRDMTEAQALDSIERLWAHEWAEAVDRKQIEDAIYKYPVGIREG